MDKIYEEVAHDSEILAVSYSKDVDGKLLSLLCQRQLSDMMVPISGLQYLASASRDRMVHVFTNTEDGYQPLQSLPDHSAAVTAVGFTVSEDTLQLLSCGADKSIIFHTLGKNEVSGGREGLTYTVTPTFLSRITRLCLDVPITSSTKPRYTTWQLMHLKSTSSPPGRTSLSG